MEEIRLINTNDLHSHFENWPKIRRYFNQQQEKSEIEGLTTISIDLGDFSDRVHPLTEATDGQANTLLMNQANYDLVTIGNNEGIGNSQKDLNRLYDKAEFTVILENVKDIKTGKQPHWAKRYDIIESKEGTRLGFIGLTAPYPLTYNPSGWDILEIEESLPSLLAELTPQVDVIILLSHLGLPADREIAEKYPEISVILGAHTHHLLEKGEVVGETLITGAGKFGRYIGDTRLKIEGKQVVAKETIAIPVATLPEIEIDESEIKEYWQEGEVKLSEIRLANLKKPLKLTEPNECQETLVSVCLEALKEEANTEVALLNTGLFLEELASGEVTALMLHRCLPHPMHLVRVTLEGAALLEFLNSIEAQRTQLKEHPIVGMGFRGKVFGEIIYSGIEKNDEGKFLWLGKEIDPNKDYSFTTVDHLLFIKYFPVLMAKGEIDFLFPAFLRQVLGQYLETHYSIE